MKSEFRKRGGLIQNRSAIAAAVYFLTTDRVVIYTIFYFLYFKDCEKDSTNNIKTADKNRENRTIWIRFFKERKPHKVDLTISTPQVWTGTRKFIFMSSMNTTNTKRILVIHSHIQVTK